MNYVSGLRYMLIKIDVSVMPNQDSKVHILKAKIYGGIGFLLLFIGLLIFMIMFNKLYDGDIVRASQDFGIFLIIVVPIAPGLFFTWLGASHAKKHQASKGN